MNLKNKVKILCEQRGISIRKLEKDLDIANGSVNKWDKVMPSGDKIMALSSYFGVEPNYFFTDDDEPSYYIDPEILKMMQEIADGSFYSRFDIHNI